mgnify:CR=1 FL=1
MASVCHCFFVVLQTFFQLVKEDSVILPSRHISTWMKRAIEKYGFEYGIDYTTVRIGSGNNSFLDYISTLDMAKELCMLDDSAKGQYSVGYIYISED